MFHHRHKNVFSQRCVLSTVTMMRTKNRPDASSLAKSQQQISNRRASTVTTLAGLFAVHTLLDVCLVSQTHDWWAVGRIMVTSGLMLHLIRSGQTWAKRCIVALLGVSVLGLSFLVVKFGQKLSSLLYYGTIVMVAYLGLELGYLGFSKDLQTYMLETQQHIGSSSKNKVP
jgi:hypothetical protein